MESMEESKLAPLVLNPPPNITKVTTVVVVEELVEWLNNHKEFGFDLETTPLRDFYWRRCRTLQFGNADKQFVVDLLAFCDTPDELYNAQGDYGKNLTARLRIVLDMLRPFLESPDWLKIGVNLGFEYMVLYWSFGIKSYGFFDCMLAERVIYAGLHSLKDYPFFSLAEMFGRYFQMQIDKGLQESFNLESTLTDAQCEYAALDTRTPLAIRTIQLLILQGLTPRGLEGAGKPKLAEYLRRVDPLVLGDNLLGTVKIENDAIGAFQDMHIHGERMDKERWQARDSKNKEEYSKLIAEKLDPIFLRFVGSKHENTTDAEIERMELEWKSYNEISSEEISLRNAIRVAARAGSDVALLTAQRNDLEVHRKATKEEKKKTCGDTKKRRTQIRNLAAKCEGEALINYGSDAQLMKVLRENFPRLSKLDSLDDEVLEKFESIPVVAAIRKYHELAKQIGTYGASWATEWKTGPCKEEGWLHPGDGRLHSVFNQFEAETGRSSSERPNGQNLPRDKEVRGCFIADEDMRLITIDMSGAELRIIAEAANDPIWIEAFQRNEDVHSVGTELLYGEEWKKQALPDCAYYKLKENGEPQRHKCNCPEHEELRDATKSVNFLLAYGGGPSTLAKRIKVTVSKASELMALHEQKFPAIWKYLKTSGDRSRMLGKAFDLFGRRRIFPEPTKERAVKRIQEYDAEKLELSEEDAVKNVSEFEQKNGRKPNRDEVYVLTHRDPTSGELSKAYIGMHSGTERQGKNHAIQGTNASMIKIAMAELSRVLPTYGARLQKMVHDELVISAPTERAEEVAKLAQGIFRKSAENIFKSITMESEFHIADHWSK